jgi:hypothetical protein
VDAGITKLRLTLIGDQSTTAVIDALRVAVTKKRDPLDGAYIVCTVGGADITARHIAVDLDLFGEPTTRYVRDGGEPTGRFRISVWLGVRSRSSTLKREPRAPIANG